MLGWQPPSVPPATGRLLKTVSAAITAIGQPDFDGRLLAALRGFVGAEHCSTFLFEREGGIRCLGAASGDGSRRAQRAADCYVAGYWREDPAFRRLREASFAGRPGLGRVQQDDIHNPAYRRDCYETPGVIDRVALYRDFGPRRVFLSVFRGPHAGLFGPEDLDGLSLAAESLTAVIARHHRFRLRTEREATELPLTPDQVASWLESFCPGLSARERGVCAASVLGATAEEIAATLGLRASSVITYRKRAYAKLGVSSSTGLAALCLEAMSFGVPA
ncbi:helix-turn-helix transcriptional regulator [Roseomonas sp. BN140053]|uniref:helix-turn-helix transcriptional regulator n=1 Tax=Roseomonas sp. BN140053 TaxID=3391898 RepID=UPI0039EAAC3A